ncbi:hypothetical protein [Kribbella sp. NPDC050459]|uniref:hypothetical protein n=1 Tax=Kribbella sp. NPDC050459 TaxID=3155785 RepID=UPI0033DF9EA5
MAEPELLGAFASLVPRHPGLVLPLDVTIIGVLALEPHALVLDDQYFDGTVKRARQRWTVEPQKSTDGARRVVVLTAALLAKPQLEESTKPIHVITFHRDRSPRQ